MQTAHVQLEVYVLPSTPSVPRFPKTAVNECWGGGHSRVEFQLISWYLLSDFVCDHQEKDILELARIMAYKTSLLGEQVGLSPLAKSNNNLCTETVPFTTGERLATQVNCKISKHILYSFYNNKYNVGFDVPPASCFSQQRVFFFIK